MRSTLSLALVAFAGSALGHGDHGKQEGETIQQYAQRHMVTEHHIDTFDLASFFHLHDLNRDGYWDKEETEAVYGVHHIYNKKKSKDDIEHQQKADHIVETVLTIFDTDKDGRISMAELDKGGLDALPNFDDAEGHHYDIESEFFLHHEEKYHNTPETQTDESYNHPEDLEHFAHHEEIERKEAEKEAQYQGVTVEEVIKQHEHDGEPAPPPTQNDQQVPLGNAAAPPDPLDPHPYGDAAAPPPAKPNVPKYVRPSGDQADPITKFRNAKKDSQAQGEWGQGDGGYKTPKTPAEKMRKNVPYKYKFKKNWGDF